MWGLREEKTEGPGEAGIEMICKIETKKMTMRNRKRFTPSPRLSLLTASSSPQCVEAFGQRALPAGEHRSVAQGVRTSLRFA